MNEMESQPNVSPPAAYKAPSFPTLAALGVISTAALVSGCRRFVMGEMPVRPYPKPQNAVEEKSAPMELGGESTVVNTVEEKATTHHLRGRPSMSDVTPEETISE